MASGHLLGPLQKGIGDRDAAGAGHLDHGSGVVLRHRPGTDYPDAKRHDDLLCDVFYRWLFAHRRCGLIVLTAS